MRYTWSAVTRSKKHGQTGRQGKYFPRRRFSIAIPGPEKGNVHVPLNPEAVARARRFAETHRAGYADFSGPVVKIGRAEELDEAEHAELEECLKAFIPWRKGPYSIYGHEVQAHWKSELKWERVLRHADALEDKIVADVGCNNGYYMFRMAEQAPRHVIGLDPVGDFHDLFGFLTALYPVPALRFAREGFEYLTNYTDHFDVIFCLGVVYHHPDPIRILRLIHRALKPGGQIVLESMGIPDERIPNAYVPERVPDASGAVSDERVPDASGAVSNERAPGERASDGGERPSYCLFPAKKYAGAIAVWFVPTAGCLCNWLRRANFRDIELHEIARESEQQRTVHAPAPVLADFLDQRNPALTVEGYPAPVRIHLSARR